MKKNIVITLLFIGFFSTTFAQTDSCLEKYEQKIIENSKLKEKLKDTLNLQKQIKGLQKEKQRISDLTNQLIQDTINLQHEIRILKKENQTYSDLKNNSKEDLIALKKEIKILQEDINSEKKKVLSLNKNKIKSERDILLKKNNSLKIKISNLNKTIKNKESEINKEKKNGETSANKAKNDGKAEILAIIVKSYKDQEFNKLIASSTKATVLRDIKLVGNNKVIKSILDDLQTYFNAKELLSQKFDAIQINSYQTKLSQITRKSELLDALKENMEDYTDYNEALKETISNLIALDKNKSADGDSEIQKMKFNEIITDLSDYMYNYYDYGNYPYLSDIVLEIIKRKQPNADADITDLKQKL